MFIVCLKAKKRFEIALILSYYNVQFITFHLLAYVLVWAISNQRVFSSPEHEVLSELL